MSFELAEGRIKGGGETEIPKTEKIGTRGDITEATERFVQVGWPHDNFLVLEH